VVVAVLPGCGDDGAPVETAGTYAVEARSYTFVDEERPTPALGSQPELPSRTLVTDVWLPSSGASDGRYPLIVFNHGQQGEPQQYASSFERWASAGYVVAAPRHPLTIRGGPGGLFVDDAVGEVGDVPFTITQVGEELADVVDLEHVAVAGHSSGAIVAFAVAFNTCCHDERVDAVLAESVLNVPFEGEYAEELRGTPLLLVHGTADPNPIEQSRAAYEQASDPKFLLTVEGGNHSEMFRDGPEASAIADAALLFFDRYLKGSGQAGDQLAELPGVESDRA
jgi:fermentation-respiration switch protein FrsA (DUF1100 family)